MGFDTPMALLGLLAASVPLLAHLVRQRRLPVVRFAPARLLVRAAEQNQRRSRITDLLLLVVRMTLVASVALAVAGPRASCALGANPDGRAESLSIVLDDSLSMRRSPGGRALFEDARRVALQELRALGPGAQAALVLGRRPAFVAVALTDDLARVEHALRAASPTFRSTDLAGAVTAASSELAAARFDARRVLVATDAARHGAPSGLPEPEGIALDVRDVGARAPRVNRAVVEAVAAADPARGDRALAVRVRVQAFGGRGGSVAIELVRAGQVLDRANVDVSSGSATAMLRTVEATNAADARAVVRLRPADDLAADDERAVLLRGAGASRVLLVDGDPRPGSPLDELHYARHALAVAMPGRVAPELRALDADALTVAEIERSDVVVLANVVPPPPALTDALARFVERGGGLLVTAGSHVAPNAYATRMSKLLATGARGVRDLGGEGTEALVVAPGHMLFHSFGGEDTGLSRVRVRRALELVPPGRSDTQVAVSLPDGSPFLVTSSRGDGRLALLATTIDADWTDLPFRPGYLPWLHALVGYLSPSSNETQGASSTPNDPVTLRLPPGASRLSVLGPDDVAVTLEPDRGGRARVPSTERPGAYVVRVQGASGGTREDLRASFVVAPDPLESDPAPLPARPRASDSGARANVAAAPEVSLSPWLFVLVGLLVIVEAVLRTRGRALRK